MEPKNQGADIAAGKAVVERLGRKLTSLGLKTGGLLRAVMGDDAYINGQRRMLEKTRKQLRESREAKDRCVRIGICKYQIGNAAPLTLSGPQDDVLYTLILLGGTATLSQRRDETGHDDANKQLAQVVRHYPELAGYISLPGRKGNGGYRTRIVEKTLGKSPPTIRPRREK
jgi:hypothetical protein